jgi:hypothetical protein
MKKLHCLFFLEEANDRASTLVGYLSALSLYSKNMMVLSDMNRVYGDEGGVFISPRSIQ